MHQVILTLDGSPNSVYNGHDIINALVEGFEHKLDFSLLKLVLDDSHQFPVEQRAELMNVLDSINRRFHQDDLIEFSISIENDIVYHMETEEGEILNPILEEMGYKQITFNLSSGLILPNLNTCADIFYEYRILLFNR